MGLQNQSREILCKLRSTFKENGIDLPDPIKDPQKIQDFKEGNCASMVDFWSGEKMAISKAAAKAILAQNDAILQSAGDGECSDDNNTNNITLTLVSKTDPTCANNDGKIEVSASGGSGGYEYKLSTSSSWQVHYGFDKLKPGNYTFQAKDYEGNIGSTTPLVVGTPLEVASSTKDPSCSANDGSITLTASGGCVALDFSIDGGKTWRKSNEKTMLFENLSAGEYECIVRDKNGAEAKKKVKIIAEGTPAIIASNRSSTCSAGHVEAR